MNALDSGYMLSEYRIEKLLGEGGFGLTYLAFDTNLEKQVAIKEYMPGEHAVRKDGEQIIAKSEASEKTYNWGLNAFLNEAKILAKFENPNIVRIYRFFRANGTAYIVMEYCQGGSLIDQISKTNPMDEDKLQSIISSIVKGLQLVHNEGILHRDIKPDNIMFRKNGTPVLIDFGAARLAIGKKTKKVTTIITPGYAPLEQYSSKGSIGPWSDIYSLAAVAYLCLTGKRPPDIMNRLHEDTLSSLSEGNNTSRFLQAIDFGLQLQVEDRPRSLSEWSSKWGVTDVAKAKEFKTIIANAPITASRSDKGATQATNTLRQPISARTSLKPDENTLIANHDIDFDSTPSFNIARVLLTLVIISSLIVAGVFGYEYFQKQKQETVIADQLVTQRNLQQIADEKKQKDLILNVQIRLNKLNYRVVESGKYDTRTRESIKLFESKNNLVVTGTADEILLDRLNQSLSEITTIAWQQTVSKNTIEAYQDYLRLYPNSLNAKEIPETIAKIKVLKQEKNNLAELEDVKNAQRLKLIEEKKAQLIKEIKIELKRLKFPNLTVDKTLDNDTRNKILSFQKLMKFDTNGLPTKTLLFQLKKQNKWPGLLNGQIIQQCQSCPTMVVVPAGNFMMGSSKGKNNEIPEHYVSLPEFIISTTEVTYNQWNNCVADNYCKHQPKSSKTNNNQHAVSNINWYDIQQFLQWLNYKTNNTYKLPSETQWEYAARATSQTAYSWGDLVGSNNVSCLDCITDIDESKMGQVKNFPSNSFGIYDMHGNVWEITADCWHPNYSGAPSDEKPWEPNGCNQFVVRGGSSGNSAIDLRSASRGVLAADKRLNSVGFRVILETP